MKFILEDGIVNKSIQITYDEESYSFEVIGDKPDSVSSYLLNDINLEVSQSGTILYIWGLCPNTLWKQMDIDPGKLISGKVIIKDTDTKITPGISKRINPNKRWEVFANPETGWLCIGDPFSEGTKVEFGLNLAAVIKGEDLKALWVKVSHSK